MRNKQKAIRILGLCAVIGAANCWAASPWLPEPGKLTMSVTYSNDEFTNYRQGANPRVLPAPYTQETYFTTFEYGLRNNLALDVETGHTATDFRGNTLGGVADSTIGLRWRAARGEHWVFTLRGAAVIRGSYDLTRLSNFSPGDGASGGLGSALLGTSLPHGFFTFSELGYLIRSKPVPQTFFGTAGGGQSFKGFTYTADYQTVRSINGVDIVGTLPNYAPPYFVAAQFPATKKIFGALDTGIAYAFKQGIGLGFNYSKILHGRNVGIKRVYAATVTYTFPGRGPHW